MEWVPEAGVLSDALYASVLRGLRPFLIIAPQLSYIRTLCLEICTLISVRVGECHMEWPE